MNDLVAKLWCAIVVCMGTCLGRTVKVRRRERCLDAARFGFEMTKRFLGSGRSSVNALYHSVVGNVFAEHGGNTRLGEAVQPTQLMGATSNVTAKTCERMNLRSLGQWPKQQTVNL